MAGTTMYFGEPWDAPVCEDVDRFPEVPTYAKCVNCDHYFEPDAQGLLMPHAGSIDADYLVGAGDGYALVGTHRLCLLRMVLGPSVDYVCPTPCDDDCDADCHEFHDVPERRDHNAESCAARAGLARKFQTLAGLRS